MGSLLVCLAPPHRLAFEKGSNGEPFTVVTTFRPELIQNADKHYSVLYKNKSSTIACATKTEALKFVQEEAGK